MVSLSLPTNPVTPNWADQRNLADTGSNRNVHTCFLASLSLAHVKAQGVLYFMGWVRNFRTAKRY